MIMSTVWKAHMSVLMMFISMVRKGRVMLSDPLDKDDQVVVPERPWVDNWPAALVQLDKYPWPQLFPLEIHPEFRDQVFKALKAHEKSGLDVNWTTWHGVLNGKD
jgi:hypothetical protein